MEGGGPRGRRKDIPERVRREDGEAWVVSIVRMGPERGHVEGGRDKVGHPNKGEEVELAGGHIEDWRCCSAKTYFKGERLLAEGGTAR